MRDQLCVVDITNYALDVIIGLLALFSLLL